MTTNMHEPNPEFSQYLEWQIASAVRRHDRFAEPVPSRGYAKYLAAAAVVVISIMIGAGGVAAAGRIQDNQQKQLLLAEQRSQMQLAKLRLSMAQKALDDAKRRASVGTAPPSVVSDAERDFQVAATALDRAKLDIAEVEASSRPVRDEITAPAVKGQDFVRERLLLDAKAASMSLRAAEQTKQQMQRRFDVGLATEVELMETDAQLLKARSELESVRDAIALRDRFVTGGIKADAALREKSLLAARSELRIAEQALELAQKRLDMVKKKLAVGTVDEQDSLHAQLEVLSRKADVAALQARIAKLERGGE